MPFATVTTRFPPGAAPPPVDSPPISSLTREQRELLLSGLTKGVMRMTFELPYVQEAFTQGHFPLVEVRLKLLPSNEVQLRTGYTISKMSEARLMVKEPRLYAELAARMDAEGHRRFVFIDFLNARELLKIPATLMLCGDPLNVGAQPAAAP